MRIGQVAKVEKKRQRCYYAVLKCCTCMRSIVPYEHAGISLFIHIAACAYVYINIHIHNINKISLKIPKHTTQIHTYTSMINHIYTEKKNKKELHVKLLLIIFLNICLSRCIDHNAEENH